MVYPVDGGSAVTYRQTPEINQSDVDHAVRKASFAIPLNHSSLADALRDPSLNQAERDQVIQRVAHDKNLDVRFYANDGYRFRNEDFAALTADQRVIADAVQDAYADGAINADDLVHIADVPNGIGNGAQRFLDVLGQSGTARTPGSAAEALADKLWARNGNDGTDRASAALFYSSDPAMMSRNLDTPDKRASAFESLVKFNETAAYDKMPGAQGSVWKSEALGGAGRLFTAHSQEFIDRYTSVTPQHGAQTEVLAKFVSQTVLNPDAQGIWMDRRQDLVPAVQNAFGNAADTFLARAEAAPKGSVARSDALEQFGRLTASISGGTALALKNYSDKVMANEESKKAFTDLVGSLTGKVVKIDTPVGNPAEDVAGALAGKLYDALVEAPKRPDAAMAGVLYDQYTSRIAQLRNDTGDPTMSADFNSGYAAELLNLQQNLNVNLGGYPK
jgi:hypothetical protein